MKIYILPVSSKLQPKQAQVANYPAGNSGFGVEQDFLKYLKSSSLITRSSDKADWHYLPVFWTRWHLNHDYAKYGVDELQAEVSKILLEPKQTFTICQYDDGPVVKLGATTLFLASRKGNEGIDIPLLRNLIRIPLVKPRKRYLASFAGRLHTYPIREQMAKILQNRKDVLISDGDKGQKFFISTTVKSRIALCPRGYGGSSFRFFEAMQLGTVPLLVGENDTRPFKKFIDWDSMSFFVSTVDKLPTLLDGLDKRQLRTMGRQAKGTYLKHLQYEKWGNFVIKELELLK